MPGELFDLGPDDSDRKLDKPKLQGGTPRLRRPQRDQVEMQFLALDEMLDSNHPVRAIWSAVLALDLGQWLGKIQAVEGRPGRSATDPRLLLALWVYATIDGVGSARRLANLCDPRHGQLGYRWLCGGVTLNHHTLSDFRSEQGNAWDDLLAQLVASLMHEGLVTMNRVAQDGMRVKANAGRSSFRRGETLRKCQVHAKAQVAILRKLIDADPQALSQREASARERAAREREERIQRAIRNYEDLQGRREGRSKTAGKPAKEARASTTDPDSRNMKFPDGGYAPGHNVQYCTDVESGIIVGVGITNVGNDSQQCLPMMEQLKRRYNRLPDEVLVDGGFASLETIEGLETQGCKVYAPVKDEKKQLAAGKDPFAKKKGESPVVTTWRKRMGTELARSIYKLRSQTAEWVNAQARNRGLHAMPVRGSAKCRTIAVLYAIAHNLSVSIRLRNPVASA